MAAVGELVLVLGLLVSARCEVRARDPEVEEEEEEGLVGRRGAAGGGGGAAYTSLLERLHPGATEAPPLGEKGNYTARTGNWCAFVQQRVVTVAVKCGTEMFTIKSQSRCPSGRPDCQLVLYKQSTRPVYRQKQQALSALLWRCCPGHGGENCEDAVSEALLDSGNSGVIEELKPAYETAGLHQLTADPDHEQNDHHPSIPEAPDHKHTHTHTANTGWQQEHQSPVGGRLDPAAPAYPDSLAALLAPHMVALVMSQLQPVLAGFNRSLEHLSRQVGDLSRDVEQLKSSQQGALLQAGPPEGPGLNEAALEEVEKEVEHFDTKLEKVFQQVREVQRQVENQRMDMENRLHSQHAMLHYNLTSFKMDIDMKLKRNQKMLQVSLQAVNATLAELKLDQDQDQDQVPEDHLEDHLEDQLPLPHLPQPSDSSALWEAIERLDNMVVNNTVKVGGLMEDAEVTSGVVQQLRRDFVTLGKQINQTARTSQIQFMETGLEVEAAREVVLQRVYELAGNLSLQATRMRELDVDMDDLYASTASTTNCDCKALTDAVARLEQSVANVTELANENRLSLEENSEGGGGQWAWTNDWEPAVEALQRRLQEVKESLASEQTRTRTLEHSVAQLNTSVKVVLDEVSGLREADGRLVEKTQHLSGSFSSLLSDAIRHSNVLELLLGEEVLEFLDWPVQDQESYSIPAMKTQLGNMQEQLREHNLSISSLLGHRTGDREEVPSADQPSSSHHLSDDWLPGSVSRSSGGAPAREQQLLLRPGWRHPEHRGDGSDLWNLEKTVEELELKVLQLQEKCCNTSEKEAPPGGEEAKLRAEVTWLKRGLEEHLKVFKNVFSNADMLAKSGTALELDKLWQLLRSKDEKKEKKRGGGGRGGTHRSRRASSGVLPVLTGQSDDSLLLVAGSPLSVSNSVVVFKASLDRGQFYSDTSGTFTAPVSGVYLFVLTLDLRPGPAHVVLRRGSGGAAVSLHRQAATDGGALSGVGLLPLSEGEEVRLQVKGGAWAESRDNVLAVLLLNRTT